MNYDYPAVSPHLPPFPNAHETRLPSEFYVLFMLCKRGSIIVKISKQIVKIDPCRLSLSFGAPWCWHTQTHTHSHTHTATLAHSNWDSPNAFDSFICGVSNSLFVYGERVAWGQRYRRDACQLSFPLPLPLSLSRLFVYRKWLHICVCVRVCYSVPIIIVAARRSS